MEDTEINDALIPQDLYSRRRAVRLEKFVPVGENNATVVKAANDVQQVYGIFDNDADYPHLSIQEIHQLESLNSLPSSVPQDFKDILGDTFSHHDYLRARRATYHRRWATAQAGRDRETVFGKQNQLRPLEILRRERDHFISPLLPLPTNWNTVTVDESRGSGPWLPLGILGGFGLFQDEWDQIFPPAPPAPPVPYLLFISRPLHPQESAVQAPQASSAEEAEQDSSSDEDYPIRCVCEDLVNSDLDHEDEDGDDAGGANQSNEVNWVLCNQYKCWQHVECMGDGVPADYEQEGVVYKCEQCDPSKHTKLLEKLRI